MVIFAELVTNQASAAESTGLIGARAAAVLTIYTSQHGSHQAIWRPIRAGMPYIISLGCVMQVAMQVAATVTQHPVSNHSPTPPLPPQQSQHIAGRVHITPSGQWHGRLGEEATVGKVMTTISGN